MKKKILSIMILLFFIGFTFYVVSNAERTLTTVNLALNIWVKNIVVSMLPFYILVDVLISCGFVNLVGGIFNNVFYKLFRVNGNGCFVFVVSMISGSPGSSLYIKRLWMDKEISSSMGEKLLIFTHFVNPLFIIGVIGSNFLGSRDIGLLILVVHYLSNIIIGIIFRGYLMDNSFNKSSIYDCVAMMHRKRINCFNLAKTLVESINRSFNALLVILGVITFFMLVNNFIFDIFSFNDITNSIISGILEMTQGLKLVSLLDISVNTKALVSTFLIGFGGFSIHMQTKSILVDTNIRYFPFLIGRLLQAVISCLLLFIILLLF